MKKLYAIQGGPHPRGTKIWLDEPRVGDLHRFAEHDPREYRITRVDPDAVLVELV